jgi:8-oxo-dGTP pyrophosphatase MutT (NUDIX family)
MAKAMRGVLPDGRIILTEQEQPGKEPFIAACGGRVDEGEEILTAAKRELLDFELRNSPHFTFQRAH